MKPRRLAALAAVCLTIARPAVGVGGLGDTRPPGAREAPRPGPVDPVTPDGATMFRLFLTDGTSLVSYGELARVGNRVVFSMPTSASANDPKLHLVNLAADRVDWSRTDRYAQSARAARYFATRAESDYATLTARIAEVLKEVSRTGVPARRLAILEKTRKTLGDWPATHFNYRQAEVRQMLGLLDEAIADLRAAAGVGRFDLSFVAAADSSAAREPLLPAPGAREVLEQVVTAARLSDSPPARTSLFAVALAGLDREANRLPAAWVAATRAAVKTELSRELDADRLYWSFATRTLEHATARAQAADVRGVQRVLDDVSERDRQLGAKRPDVVNALIASVQAQLDAARRLRLARDRWELRRDDFRRYETAMRLPQARLSRLKGTLDDIKLLAGSPPEALDSAQRTAAQVIKMLSGIVPPVEVRGAHALFLSAAQLADSAARMRREAVLKADMGRAWDAASAAAGALMLLARASTELQTLVRPPPMLQ